MKQHLDKIGQRLIFTAQRVPAPVLVVDVREAYGRLDYQVQDCTGRTTWVNSTGCVEAPAETTNNKRKAAMTIDEQNDAARAQVEREFPSPVGGFENDDDEEHWRLLCDARFLEICREFGPADA